MPARLAIGGVLACAAAVPLAAQTPAPRLETVLARAAAYVEEFRERLSGIVAQETYVQQERPGGRRELRSDLLLVRTGTFPRWLQYRDTFEVDGHAVRDRADRLSDLFLQPSPTAAEQARRIAAESSRYNLGILQRTINVPLMPLVFLETDVQTRLRFSRQRSAAAPTAAREPALAGHFRVTTEVWVIGFEERERPTIIRDPVNRRDVVARGRFWIEPHSGRVLMSEMRATHADVTADITVSYQSEPLAGLLVPIAMHERYENRQSWQPLRPTQTWRRIEATAVYDRFRQIGADPDQRLDLPTAAPPEP